MNLDTFFEETTIGRALCVAFGLVGFYFVYCFFSAMSVLPIGTDKDQIKFDYYGDRFILGYVLALVGSMIGHFCKGFGIMTAHEWDIGGHIIKFLGLFITVVPVLVVKLTGISSGPWGLLLLPASLVFLLCVVDKEHNPRL